jgi:hypothetical protein
LCNTEGLSIEQRRDRRFELRHVRHFGVWHLRRTARLLPAMAAGAEANGDHTQRLGGRDVLVEPIPDHEAAARHRIHCPIEQTADADPVQLREQAIGRVAGEAEPEIELAQFPQQVVDPRSQLEDVEVGDHRLDALAHALDGARVAAQRLDHVGVGVRCERLDGALRGLVDGGLVEPDALHAAGRGDRTLDRNLVGKLHVDRPADIEQDGAPHRQAR